MSTVQYPKERNPLKTNSDEHKPIATGLTADKVENTGTHFSKSMRRKQATENSFTRNLQATEDREPLFPYDLCIYLPTPFNYNGQLRVAENLVLA